MPRFPRPAVGLVLCAGFLALTPGPSTASLAEPQPAAPSPPLTGHMTDEQDRLMSGRLALSAENRAQADALYTDAMISLDAPNRDLPKALADLRQVVQLDPDFDEAQSKIGDVLLQTGQIEAAFQQLEQAAAKNPKSAQLEAMLGYTQRLRGHNDEALKLSTQALRRDSTQAASMRALLEIAGDQDDLDGAVLHIEDILRSGGGDVPAASWLTLGRLYMEIARNESRPLSGDTMLRTLLPIYREAAAKPPPDVDRLNLLSETYQGLDRKREALDTLLQARDLEPSNVDVLLGCARLEMDLEEKAKALRDYQQAYDLNPNLAGVRDMLGGQYLDNGRFADAERIFKDALADRPNDPDLEADLGVAYEGGLDHAQAQAWFQRAFTSPGCPPEAYLKLAVFQLANHQIAEAGETLSLARKRFPDSPQILFYQAIQNRYARNYAAALACLHAMRELASPSESDIFTPNYYLESALTLSLAGHDAEIEPLLREGLARYPENSDLMNELAYSWTDHGVHLDEALALSERAARLDPDNGAIQDTWGWVYFKLGKVDDALPYLQRAAIMTDNDPVVLEHVGDALLKLGHRREAIEAWRRALRKDPANRDLATRIIAAQAPANHAYSRSAPHP